MEEFLKALQIQIAKLIKFEWLDVSRVRLVAGVDVSYKNKKAVAVIQDLKTEKIVEINTRKVESKFPYIPGLFAFKEGSVILKVLSRVKSKYDMLFVDGHGYAHPRRAGLACIVGLLVGKPTIGVAKKLLVGKVKDKGKVSPIIDKGEIVGYRIKTGKTFYVSPGYKIDLESMLKFFGLVGFEYPQVLEMADRLSKS